MKGTKLDDLYCDLAEELNLTYGDIKRCVDLIVSVACLKKRKSKERMMDTISEIPKATLYDLIIEGLGNKSKMEQTKKELEQERKFKKLGADVSALKSVFM